MSEPPGRHRGWSIVINNYTPLDIEQVEALKDVSLYVVYAFEVGEQCGTPHIQGYVRFKDAKSGAALSKLIPRSHNIAADGTAAQNRVYVVGPYDKNGKHKPYNPDHKEYGQIPNKQGARNDLQATYALLREGANMDAIIDTDPNLQCLLVAEKYLKYKEPARDFKPVIHWLWGDPGTGKSKDAEAAFKGVFYSPPPTSVAKFWDCYDAQENVIIDDIDPGDIPYRMLLRMLDRYAYRVETKGGSRQLLAKTMYICTEEPPERFVPPGKDAYALFRRLTSVTHYRRAEGVEPNYYPAQYVKEVDDASGSQERGKEGPLQEEDQAGDSPGDDKNINPENNLGVPLSHGLPQEIDSTSHSPRALHCIGCSPGGNHGRQSCRSPGSDRTYRLQGLQELSRIPRRSCTPCSQEEDCRRIHLSSLWERWPVDCSLCEDQSGSEDVNSV